MEVTKRINLSKGRYIDFRCASMWKAAKIIEVESGKLLVRFVSHNSRKEEQRVRMDSPLIATFRTRTIGYTGEAKTSIKLYQFPSSEIELALAYMDGLIKKPVYLWDQEEFAQRGRGDLFFLLDFLLTTLHLGKITEDMLNSALACHSKFFQLFFHWLQNDALINDEFKNILNKKERSPSTLFSDDLIELLNLYFSNNKRVNPTFQMIFAMIHKPSGVESELKISGVARTAEYFFLQLFTNECFREIMRAFIDKPGLPLVLVFSFMSTFNFLAENVENPEVETKMIIISTSLIRRLTELVETDMKELEEISLPHLLSTIKPFLRKVSEISKSNIQDEIEIAYIMKTLESESPLRKRLGIEALCKKCQLQELISKNKDYIRSEYNGMAQYAVGILKEMEIMKFLLSDHIDPELINASKDIFRVMLLTNNFSLSEIFVLLSCFLNSQGRLRIVLMDTIVSLAEYAPYLVLEEIFKELQQVKLENYDEVFINFIANYTINAIRNVESQKKRAQESLQKLKKKKIATDIIALKKIIAQNETLYDIDIFWNIFSSTSPRISSKLQQSAMNGLITIARLNDEIGNYYIIKALTLIRAGDPETIRYMHFFMHVFKSLNPDSKKRDEILSSTGRSHKILPTIVENLILYKQVVDKEVKQHPENLSIMSTMYSSGYKHEEFIRGHFEFIAYLSESTKQKISLGKEEVEKLWNTFIIEANCIEETNCFFTQLLKAKELSGKLCFQLLNEEQVNNLFSNYFMTDKFPIRSLNNIQYNSFKTLFVSINILKGILRYEARKLITLKEPMHGINKLWDIAFECVDKEISEQASKFLISLYSQVSKDKLPKLGEISKIFSSNALKKASQSIEASSEVGFSAGSCSDRVLQAIQMVSSYIQEIEGPRYAKIEKALYFAPPLLFLQCVVEFPGGQVSEMNVNINQKLTILHFKKALSNMLKTPVTCLTLRKFKNNKILDERYDQDFIIHNDIAFRVKVKDSEIPKAQLPSYAIANNDFCQRTLFKFMKLDEKYSTEIWELIRRFPENTTQIDKLINLEFKVEDIKTSWLTFLGLESESLSKNSLNSLAHNIYSIQRLLLNKMLVARRPENYPVKFANKMGFQFLLLCLKEALSGTTPEQVSGSIRLCLYLFKSLKCLIFSHLETKALEIPDEFELIEKVLQYLNSLIYSDKIKLLLMSKKILGLASKTIANAVSFLNSLSFYSKKKTFQYLLKENAIFEKILIDGVVRGELPELCGGILPILVNDIESSTAGTVSYFRLLISLLLQLIIDPSIFKGKIQKGFFEFLYKIIEKCKDDLMDFMLVKDLRFADLTVQLLIKKYEEPEAFPYSISYIRLLFSLLKRFNKIIWNDPRSEQQLVDLCLRIAIPGVSEKGAGKAEIQYYFELLAVICFSSEEYMSKIVRKMWPTLSSAEWRTDNKLDWEIEVLESLDQCGESQAIGLDNPSNICYMNSVLQQLHLVPGFRKGVLEVSYGELSSKEVLDSLKEIFENLRNPSRNSYNAAHLCRSVKDFEGQPLSIHEQRDADEFLNLLLDRFGDELKETNRPSLIQDVFGGEFVNEIISLECSHRSIRKEEYLAVNLQIQNKKSLEECLNSFIETEELTGANAYDCMYCNKKVNARKRVTFGVMPNTLIIVLKRFEFDFQQGIKKKINEYLEFPTELNLEKFANFSLMKKEIMDKSQNSEENKINDEERNILGITLPGWYFQYKLKGVVLHEGTANSGHYTSLALSRDSNQWMEFNDSRVKPFHIELLQATAFGGQASKNGGRQRTAYILVYEREDFLQMSGIRQIHEELMAASQKTVDSVFEQSIVTKKTLFTIQMSSEMEKMINKDQLKIQRVNKNLNSSSVSFMIEAITTTTDNSLETWKYFVAYSLIGLLHVTARNQYPKVLNVICSHNDLELSKWILQIFSNPHIMIEFFISCPCKESRFFSYSLFLNAFRAIYKVEEFEIFQYATNTELIQKKLVDIIPKKYLSTFKFGLYPLIYLSEKVPICLVILQNIIALLPLAFRTRKCITYCYLFDSISRVHTQLLKLMLVYHLPGLILEFQMNSVGEFTNKSIPLLVLKNIAEIGYENVTPSNSYRQTVVSHGNPMKQKRSLLSLLSRLLQQCGEPTEKKHSMYLTFYRGIIPHKLSEKEQELVQKLQTALGMNKIFRVGNENAGKGGIDRLYSHLCFNSLDFSKTCIKYCLDELVVSHFRSFPIYLMTLEQILLQSDNYQKERINYFVVLLQEEYIEKFQDSFITFSYIVDLCIDLTLRNEYFHKRMREKSTSLIPLMGKWVSKYEVPKNISRKKTSVKKEAFKAEFLPEDVALMKQYSKWRLNILRQLEKISAKHRTLPEFAKLSNLVQRNYSALDSDLSNSEIKEKEFDIYVNKQWTKGRVISSCIDIIYFDYQEKGHKLQIWLKPLSGKIYPSQSRTDCLGAKYYCSLLKYMS